MTNKSNKRKFLATTLTATMVAAAVAPVAGAAAENGPFPDVPADHAYAGVIADMAKAGIVAGGTDGNFNLGGKITRAEAAQMVAGLLDLKTGESKNETKFEDVKSDVWYTGAINSLVAEGIIAGVSEKVFEPGANITRGQLAQLLVVAYGLEDVDVTDVKLPFTDVEEDAWYTKPIKQLYSAGLIKGQTENTFGPKADMKRGDFAWLAANVDYELGNKLPKPGEEVEVEGITSVKAINDTTIEVKFGKALDKDIAREIEDDKERFAIYTGGQTANTANIIKSEFISFNDDYTVATVDLSDTPETDINYTVALMSGNNNTTADVMYESKQLVLKAGAEQPTLEVNADQDKFILDFKVKMDSGLVEAGAFDLAAVADADAFDVDEKMIAIYDNNDKFIADIQDLAVDDTVKWVDSTTRKAIEFKIEPGMLQAGKTYKVKVGKGVETDDGDVLSDSKRTIKVSTPTIDKARPVAKFARVTGKDEIQVVFDKDLKEATTDELNVALIDVTTATNKDIDVESAVVEADGKILTITLVEEELKENQSYKVNLKENTVANNVFQNALNKATTGIKAEAQANDPIKKMSAKFERQHDNKDKADLLLTFDQRADLEGLVDALKTGLTIEEGGKTYEFANGEVEYDVNDATGKTVRIKDITADDAFNETLKLESGKSYKVKVARNTVATDSMAATKVENTVELTSTISGLDVTAPVVDNVTFESESKMVVEFDKPINTKVSASDVYVLGYKLNRSGDFSELVALNDENHIKVSASGSKLTITAVDNDIKFVTGAIESDVDLGDITAANAFFALKADKIKGTNDVEAKAQYLTVDGADSGDVKLTVDGGAEEAIDAYDNAAPVMIGSAVTDEDTLQITYSENVKFKDDEQAGRQYTFDGLETKNYGTPIAANDSTANIVEITFDVANAKDVLEHKAYSNLKITYKNNSTYQLQDTVNKAAKNQSITGAKKRN